MASRPSYRPGKPKLSRYGISKAPSSVNISAAFFGSRNDEAVNSSSSSFAFFMCDPFFVCPPLEWAQFGQCWHSGHLAVQRCKHPLRIVLFEVELMCCRRGEDLEKD